MRHGHAGHVTRSRTYMIWQSMVKRCTNQKYKRYKDYGGAGITVCPRWRDFANFLTDMRECPPDLSIDRIDNTRGYEPGNCRWATVAQQARNTSRTRMIEFNGETLCLRDWERRIGLGYGTLWRRLAKGETVPHCMRPTK